VSGRPARCLSGGDGPGHHLRALSSPVDKGQESTTERIGDLDPIDAQLARRRAIGRIDVDPILARLIIHGQVKRSDTDSPVAIGCVVGEGKALAVARIAAVPWPEAQVGLLCWTWIQLLSDLDESVTDRLYSRSHATLRARSISSPPLQVLQERSLAMPPTRRPDGEGATTTPSSCRMLGHKLDGGILPGQDGSAAIPWRRRGF
jgi:hypothetical protein